jgi:hypothetical protein
MHQDSRQKVKGTGEKTGLEYRRLNSGVRRQESESRRQGKAQRAKTLEVGGLRRLRPLESMTQQISDE